MGKRTEEGEVQQTVERGARRTRAAAGERARRSASAPAAAGQRGLPAGAAPVAPGHQLVSCAIRERLRAAGKRFHANDNIADFIEEGELYWLEAEVEARVQQLLESLIIDIDNDHNSVDTAGRVARMFIREVFRGRYVKMPPLTEFPNVEKLNELMVVGPITVRSACSHHLVPILGKVWIGVLPNESSNLIGLSKYARIVEWVMSRPQIQEEAIQQLADKIEGITHPDGLAIVIAADHFCTHWRGVKDDQQMTNSVMRGAFLRNQGLRREFLALMNR